METNEYFKKWLDEKFKELGSRIEEFTKTSNREIAEIRIMIKDVEKDAKDRIDAIEKEQKTINYKIWVATGAIIIISGFAVYFLASFKNLNEYQVIQAVDKAMTKYNK